MNSVNDVSKCNLKACDNYSTCGYGQSKHENFYDFKRFCYNKDKYFLQYDEGQGFRDSVVDEAKEISVE